MTKEELLRAIGSVDDQQIIEAETPQRRLRLWPRAAALAACLALIAAAALTLPRQADNTADAGAGNSDLDGSEYSTSDDRPGDMIHDPDIGGPAVYSKNVDIGQLDGPPPAADVEGDMSSACLVWLEPEEIFAMDTAIFRGTVTTAWRSGRTCSFSTDRACPPSVCARHDGVGAAFFGHLVAAASISFASA